LTAECIILSKEILEINMISPERPTIVSTRVIVEYGPDIAVLQRTDKGEFQGVWELPGGKVDLPHETIAEGAVREVGEETGIEIDLLPFGSEIIDDRIIPVWDGKHGGKRYISHAFLGSAASREVVLNPKEHKDWLWLPPPQALKLPLSQTSRNALMALGSLCSSPIKKPSE
jgi:dATP pyrophosphohydrolase